MIITLQTLLCTGIVSENTKKVNKICIVLLCCDFDIGPEGDDQCRIAVWKLSCDWSKIIFQPIRAKLTIYRPIEVVDSVFSALCIF